jgi:hypothetical protein
VMVAVGDAIRNVYWVAGLLVLMIIAAGALLPRKLSPTNAGTPRR